MNRASASDCGVRSWSATTFRITSFSSIGFIWADLIFNSWHISILLCSLLNPRSPGLFGWEWNGLLCLHRHRHLDRFLCFTGFDPPFDFGFTFFGQLQIGHLLLPSRRGAQMVEGDFGDVPPAFVRGVAPAFQPAFSHVLIVFLNHLPDFGIQPFARDKPHRREQPAHLPSPLRPKDVLYLVLVDFRALVSQHCGQLFEHLAPGPRSWPGPAPDRKSTRLNSSHLGISYA